MADAGGEAPIRLWPDGPPGPKADPQPAEIGFTDPAGKAMVRNVSDPTLTVVRPAEPNGVGVIIAPGGGWRMLSWQNEGTDLAAWLAGRGYTAFVLKYRLMPTPPDPAQFAAGMAGIFAMLVEPLPAARAPRTNAELLAGEPARLARATAGEDARRALEIVRDRAAEWDIDAARIGMVGFSAGAVVTADLAMARPGDLAFIAPIYGGSTDGAPVPSNAPPLFTVVASDDRRLFKLVEGLSADWSDADRPAELHVFARGGHGFGVAPRGLPVDRWLDLFADWLADQGLA
jgi:acetyl esterase/lipase